MTIRNIENLSRNDTHLKKRFRFFKRRRVPNIGLISLAFSIKSRRPRGFELYEDKTEVLADIDYGSQFENGVLDINRPKEFDGRLPLIFWIHGGGYVGSDKQSTSFYTRALASRGYITANINYALAPLRQYPTPLAQAEEAMNFLLDRADIYGIDPSRIYLGGDSAGAQLASQYAALITNRPYAEAAGFDAVRIRPAGLILFCGFYNMDTLMATHFPFVKHFMWAYTGEKKLRRFSRKDEMSAVRHIGPDYPPVFVVCGDADPFRTQVPELTAALASAGVPCREMTYDGKKLNLGHEFQFNLDNHEAQNVFAVLTRWLEEN